MQEICAHSGDMREKYAIGLCLICCNMQENMRYAHLAKICGPEECAPHSRNRNCRNRECRNRNLYPLNSPFSNLPVNIINKYSIKLNTVFLNSVVNNMRQRKHTCLQSQYKLQSEKLSRPRLQ